MAWPTGQWPTPVATLSNQPPHTLSAAQPAQLPHCCCCRYLTNSLYQVYSATNVFCNNVNMNSYAYFMPPILRRYQSQLSKKKKNVTTDGHDCIRVNVRTTYAIPLDSYCCVVLVCSVHSSVLCSVICNLLGHGTETSETKP